MSTREDVKSLESEPAEEPLGDEDPTMTVERLPAGRIVHDERGSAIWQWAGDPESTGSGSGVLKHLDPNDLKVQGQSGRFVASSVKGTPVRDPGGGYDPYNRDEPKSNTGAPDSGKRAKR